MNKPLTTIDMRSHINRDYYSKKNFFGVFPRNRLPDVFSYPCSYVINTDPSTQPGEHWLGFYYDKNGNCDFFDSFGNPPSFYGLENYIKLQSTDFCYNSQQLQHENSGVCGYYVIHFIQMRSRHFTLSQIVSLFSTEDFKLNDFLIGHITFNIH